MGNGRVISKLLSGFARQITMRAQKRSKWRDIDGCVAESEALLKLYLQICAVRDWPPEIEIFNGICNVYAASGDITSCFDILHCLLDGQLPPIVRDGKSLNTEGLIPPSPNTFTFNTCLKSLVYCPDLHQNKE